MGQRQDKGKQVKIAYNKTFESVEGKEVLYDLMNTCNFMGSSILDSNSYEPLAMAFRDGQKAIVSRILTTLSISNEQFIKMIEQKQQSEEEEFNFED